MSCLVSQGGATCLAPYNRKHNVFSASLNKTLPFFLPSFPGRGVTDCDVGGTVYKDGQFFTLPANPCLHYKCIRGGYQIEKWGEYSRFFFSSSSSYFLNTYIHIHTHTYVRTYIHTYIHTYVRAYIHTHTYVHTYTHTCIHTYIHTYTYTYIHTYVRTYIHMSRWPNG